MTKPNILLIVSDQERQRDWLPAGGGGAVVARPQGGPAPRGQRRRRSAHEGNIQGLAAADAG